MSTSIVVRFDEAGRIPQLARSLAELERPDPWLKRWAATGSREARESARSKNYREIARSIRTGAIDSSSGSILVIAEAVHAAQRNYGGVIRAPGKGPYSRKSSMLVIPVSKFAKGKTRFEVEQQLGELFFVRANGQLLLATQKKGKRGGIEPHFVLKKQVFQRGNPFWPIDDRWHRIGEDELIRLLKEREAKINADNR